MRILINITIITMLMIVGMLYFYGYFASPTISEEITGPYILVYEKHSGDYKNSARIMEGIHYDLVNNHHLETKQGFGIYYDDPEKVGKEQLRSLIGCIVKSDTGLLDPDLQSRYIVREFPSGLSVVATFPYKGQLSIAAGVIRTYPVLKAFLQERKLPASPIMEIYDMEQDKILYIAPYATPSQTLNSFLEITQAN